MIAFRSMRFDLTDLRLFLLVVEAGSITHGAVRANLALPSASERLRGMEEVSGVRLLERRRRGITPTAAGEALAHHARIVLRQIDHMRGELGVYAKGLKGNIRLLANTAAITEFLPEALAPYLATRPHIDIVLNERLSTEIVKAVAGGLAEIGIISDAVDAGNLQLLPFAVDRLVLVVPADHPSASARALAFAEVVGQEFVGLTIGSPLQEHIDEHAARAGHPLKFRVRMRTFEGICRMVAQGVGIGIVPEIAAKKCRRSMPIRSVRLTDDWATRRLLLCMRAIEDLSPFARDLVEHLRTVAKGKAGSQ
ncbi:LysR substrate-binding domain-containing protein [Rhizobium sp. CB3171]|uniref:LysR substrate-binding domain-containing protein n=1 Tax=Rhizobium sp. CB3171 TaxID=3039157 RepID=UPI0032C214B1